ncbi:MAG: right-handed parallel beta-helix repeat-containing protein [Candidatus Bathyarchaeota archaeon]|nr:right-handed parallel beta-helix repeat-containing protein [Candidatus Bathyarchaeota archaeon]
MDRKLAWAAVLASLFLTLLMTWTVTSVHAETGAPFPSSSFSLEENFGLPSGFVDANGTVFRIINSSYCDVTVTSSEFVHVLLESSPRVVSYSIESLCQATTTTLNLSGFLSNTLYYRYQDGNLTEGFTTDSVGGYSYVQDISSQHHILIVDDITTIYIRPDGTVYSDTGHPVPISVSVIDGVFLYTFTDNIYETLAVQRDNIIIDGNGYTIQGPEYRWGLLLYGRSNVTVRNIRITGFNLGIYLWNANNCKIENITATKMVGLDARGIVLYISNNNRILGNNATDNDWGGIFLLASSHNTISGNTATGNQHMGILLYRSLYNTVSCNKVMNNGHSGIGLSFSSDNIISGNSVTNNGYTWFKGGIVLYWLGGNIVLDNDIMTNYGGILFTGSSGNLVYHNNFISNMFQANSWASVNALDDGYPSGGNYWSDYTGVDLYSGPDQNQPGRDGIGDTNYTKWGIVDCYPFLLESGWKKYYLTIETEPSGITTIPGEGWYDEGIDVALQAPTIVPVSLDIQYRFDHWTVDGDVVYENLITLRMDGPCEAKACFVEQYYLTVASPYDTAGGEGWYDAGETTYATLAIGLEYVDGLAYGFVCWSGDGSGWDLISDPILVDAPKTVIANWEASTAYSDIRTTGFWKHQVNVWYFTELANTGMKIRGIGTAQVSQEELIAHLKFISENSGYTKFQGIWVEGSKLATLENAYDILKTPRGPDSMKMRAEQQLLVLWLNLADKAFWNTQLSQDTVYVYCQYTFDENDGLAIIGEAVLFCEAELLKPDGSYEATKNICDSINNNLGILWGT